MPRYFFDFRQGNKCCPDTDGSEFPNVEQAYLEGIKGVQDMWSDLLRQRQDPRRCFFEVRDEQRELLFVLPFQEALDSCSDREQPKIHSSFEQVLHAAERTRRASKGFVEALRSVHETLEQSRKLLEVET